MGASIQADYAGETFGPLSANHARVPDKLLEHLASKRRMTP